MEKYYRILLGSFGLLGLVIFGFFVYSQMLRKKVRQVTHSLHVWEQSYEKLVEFAPDLIHMLSSDGSILHVNRVALQVLHYTPEELRGLRVWDLVQPDSQNEMRDFVQSIFQKGHGRREFIMCAKNGNQVYVETSAVVVGEGNSVIACLLSRDLSDHKRLEAELIQSERLALMGEMAAGIAHEINNPLGIILANVEEMLAQGDGLDEWKDNLQAIARNALRASKFIEDLLSFTRPGPPSKVEFDVLSLLDESLLLCNQHLKKKQIQINKYFPPRSVIVEGDYSQIQQVMVNVLLNSIQAIEQRGLIKLNVWEEHGDGNGRIHVEISDTGVGIPKRDLARIFDPFFTARKNKGFGLGLSISKRIVEKHGGKISIESKEGQGTTVHIELPKNQ